MQTFVIGCLNFYDNDLILYQQKGTDLLSVARNFVLSRFSTEEHPCDEEMKEAILTADSEALKQIMFDAEMAFDVIEVKNVQTEE